MRNTIKAKIKKYFLLFWDDSFKTETNIDISRKILLLNYLFIAITLFLIPFGILAFVQNNILLGSFDLFIATSIFIARIYYFRTQNYNFLNTFILHLLGTFFLYLVATGGYQHTGPFWAFIFPVTAFFMLGSKKGLKAVLLFLVALLIIIVLSPFHSIYSVGYKVRYLGAFIATATITYYIEFIQASTQKLLSSKNKELQEFLSKLDKKEHELREREAYYRTLFEKSNDAVFLMCNNTFVDCNNKALSLFNCEKNDILGKTPYDFSPAKQPNGNTSKETAKNKIETALKGKHQYFEWVFKKFDGNEFYSEVSLDKIEFHNRKSILASIRDISDRKKSESALLEAKEKAERSERIKSDFLAQMSHEIRTPINTIMNYTYLLKTEFEDQVSEDNKGSFNSIENAAGRLLRTIDLILNISDIEAGTYEPRMEVIPIINRIIEPATNEFKQSAENKKLKLEIINNLKHNSKVNVDSYTVYQTVANLIDNAIKYTKTGKVQVIISEDDKNICVKIKDTGIGISKEYIPHLFDKFSQEEAGYTRKFEGNGLGLALVKKYCDINNIDIFIDSEKNIGTTFTLKIPQAA